MLTEPDVALTDYALMLECFCFCFFLGRQVTPRRVERNWIVAGFAALGMASLLGGTVHGFFVQEMVLGHRILWPLTLLSIGGTALAGWAVGSRILLQPRAARVVTMCAAVGFALYAVVILFVDQAFRVAILFYLPPALFLLTASSHIYRRNRLPIALTGFLGLALTLSAPIFQQAKVGFPSLHLNHNAVYHIIQAVALAMVFVAARWYITKGDLS